MLNSVESWFRQRVFSGVGSDLLDFFIPPRCCCCVKFLEPEELTTSYLCQDCLNSLPQPLKDTCRVCSAPVGPFTKTESGCLFCRSNSPAFVGAVSLGIYQDHLRKLCLASKGFERQALVSALAEILYERNRERFQEWNCDLVTTVPMFWRGRLRRKLHPNETIAATLAQKLKIPVRNWLLYQKRNLPKQSSLSVTKRRESVVKAYGCRPWFNLENKSVLLVDDVLTTGSTVSACARELLKQGASRVQVAVLARGLGKLRGLVLRE